MDNQNIRCTSIGVYEQALTRGKHYDVVDADEEKYRIVGDHGRRVWISKYYFSTNEEAVLILGKWDFDDEWCIITTPQKLVEHFNNEFMDPPGIYLKHLNYYEDTE